MVQLILCRLVPCFGLNRSCLDRVGKSDSLSHHHEGPQAMTISHFNAFWATLSAGSLLRNTSQLTHRYTPTKSKFAYSCHQHGTKTTSQRDIEASATAAGNPVCSHAICSGLWCHWLGSRGLCFVATWQPGA